LRLALRRGRIPGGPLAVTPSDVAQSLVQQRGIEARREGGARQRGDRDDDDDDGDDDDGCLRLVLFLRSGTLGGGSDIRQGAVGGGEQRGGQSAAERRWRPWNGPRRPSPASTQISQISQITLPPMPIPQTRSRAIRPRSSPRRVSLSRPCIAPSQRPSPSSRVHWCKADVCSAPQLQARCNPSFLRRLPPSPVVAWWSPYKNTPGAPVLSHRPLQLYCS
jgi:hypothetical protein